MSITLFALDCVEVPCTCRYYSHTHARTTRCTIGSLALEPPLGQRLDEINNGYRCRMTGAHTHTAISLGSRSHRGCTVRTPGYRNRGIFLSLPRPPNNRTTHTHTHTRAHFLAIVRLLGERTQEIGNFVWRICVRLGEVH